MRLQCPKFSPRSVVKRHFKQYVPGWFSADIVTVPFHVAHIFEDPEDACVFFFFFIQSFFICLIYKILQRKMEII